MCRSYRDTLYISLAVTILGLLAVTFATEQHVVQVKTVMSEKPIRGGWDHKVSCQKSFSGKFSPEMKAAIGICRERHPIDQVCNYHCLSNILELISIKKKRFNKHLVSSVLKTHLTKKGGSKDVHRLRKQLYSCEKHIHLLAKPCQEQTALWDCVDAALTCG